MPPEFEQQADCFAGAYMRRASNLTWVQVSDVDEVLIMIGYSGDQPGTDERLDAFLRGFDGGLANCGLGFDLLLLEPAA